MKAQMGKTVIAMFDRHEPVEFTRSILRALMRDPECVSILDTQTGEIIWERGDKR